MSVNRPISVSEFVQQLSKSKNLEELKNNLTDGLPLVTEFNTDKNLFKPTKKFDFISKFIAVSGRTKEECETIIRIMRKNSEDGELIDLLNNIYSSNHVDQHYFRGYSIIGEVNITKIEKCEPSYKTRPVWFIFTGAPSYWPGMGKKLMKLRLFRKSIYRSAEVLKTMDIDLINIIQNSTDKTIENVINSFVTVSSTQIALVDLLDTIGIKPDGLIGVSLGEVACAYADGSLTLEQAILSAYWRGRSIHESNLIPGALGVAAVSLDKYIELCPPDIEIVAHLSADTVQFSGPIESVEKFVVDLKEKGIRSKMSKTYGPLHSKYMEEAGIKLKEQLKNVIPQPKERSSMWLSTSVPESNWGSVEAKCSSAEYFVNSLIRPYWFYETIKHIPDNAITVEVSLDNRHWTLKTFMEKTLPNTTTHIGLHKWDNPYHIDAMISGIGELYIAGASPDIQKLQ